MSDEAVVAIPPVRPAEPAVAPAMRRGEPLGRALGTVLFFAAVGPLIGTLVLGFGDILTVARQASDAGAVLYFLFALVSVGVPAAYAMGLVPAAVVGVFFAVVDFGRRRSDPWLAVVVGALGGMLWPVPWGASPATLASPLERQLLLASIVSTLVCWFAATRGRRAPAGPAP